MQENARAEREGRRGQREQSVRHSFVAEAVASGTFCGSRSYVKLRSYVIGN